jgi:spermidine dehydrogenase
VNDNEYKSLGMDRSIPRRDFISGMATGLVGMSMPHAFAQPSSELSGIEPAADITGGDRSDPPTLTGLRGQYPGSFETAHRARDGAFGINTRIDVETGEEYDLVIVGGGISGLAAAYFFRRDFGNGSKILIIDNHDDFGGHAKRNEFHHNGRMYLVNGGTLSIECPYPFSFTAKSLVEQLGITVEGYNAKHQNDALYAGLTHGVFFDKEHFLSDKLVAGAGSKPWAQFFAEAPLSGTDRADLLRLFTEQRDYMPGLDPMQKADALKKISYQTYLRDYVKVSDTAISYFAGDGYRNNKRVDTCPAYEAWQGRDLPGFSDMKIDGVPQFRTDYEAHFPDGNATIARLLVNRLVPAALPGTHDMNSIVTAQVDYSKLDSADAPVRIRLNSTAVLVRHDGEAGKAHRVDVVYMKDGKACRVRGRNVILACFNNIIRFIVPDLPEEQKKALAYPSKVPMQYTNVLLRNWRPWKQLGVWLVTAPHGYHTFLDLDFPVSLGDYKFNDSPDDPIVVRMIRNPNAPGLPRKEQQRMGRLDMLNTTFERSELEIRRQLARILGPGGFDPREDILAITVNRWPHGYAYTYDTLGDPIFAEHERPHVIGRRPFGRIAIANADAGAAAFTNEAIDQAERAVHDCLYSNGYL